MAEMVVSASVGVMKPLLAKLTTLMGDEYKKLKDVRKEVVFLVDELSAMEAFLEKTADADKLDPQAKNWRNHVREMAYDIEDCIDDFMHHLGGANDNLGFLEKAVSYIKTWKDRPRIANQMVQIQEIKARVIQASDRRKRYKLDECITNSSSVDVDPRLSALYKESASLVGIDDPREELIEWVTDKGQQLKVVSIVGFGGLGKTTLANEVYRKIGWHFNCKAFVSVSLRPDMTRLLNALLSQLGLQPSHHACDVQDLINNLREYLQHKRYFMIVDDLWGVPEWDIIRCAFPENNQSSRVIITTRNEDVARSCSNNGCVYKMEPLSHSDSRRLFFNRIFRSEDACPSQFKEASCEILKKCGGLPLAIITISGLLASQPTRLKEQWEYIRNSLGSQFATNPTLEGMRQILNFSYENLPPHLKTCLLYLGIYPEDHEIFKHELLARWIAEGFVSALHGRDLVDVAESYFNELVNRSLIQPKYTLGNSEVFSCGVHDMMLDLILSRCTKDNFLNVVYDPQSMQGLRDKVRRLSMNLIDVEDDDGTIPVTTTNLSHVRSLALFRKSPCLPSPLWDFKFLRVLAIEFSDFMKGESSLDLTGITRLFQLKYLKIWAARTCKGASKSSIQLPTHIGGLRHLETLDIYWARVNGIPIDIADLPRLMHLIVPYGTRLPDRIGNMESLRTLLWGFDMTESSLDSIKSLGELKNLRELGLCFDGRVARAGTLSSSVEKLRNLRRLRVVCGSRVMSADVLSSWSTPPTRHLETLGLPALSFSRVPRWVGDLRNLWDLALAVREVLEDDVHLLGDLPSLSRLCLLIPQVPAERIVISGMGFPALERFMFGCGRMSYLTFTAGAIPTLQTLWLQLFVDTWDHGTPVGTEHLLSLNNIYLYPETSENTTPSERQAAVTAFRTAAQVHPTSPAFTTYTAYTD